MPYSEFIKKHKISKSFRVSQIQGLFDIQSDYVEHKYKVNIPIENKNWNIGVIVGKSGTGKTTIAKELFPDYLFFEKHVWSKSKTILDDFDPNLSVQDVTNILSRVGFACPVEWLKPYDLLSNGEKMRVDIARLIIENNKPVVYDEFTSFMDRQVAQIGSAVVSRFCKRNNRQFIAVTCHHDILNWIEPDWVFNTDTMDYTEERLRRPQIKLDIRKGSQSEWKIFEKYHYLSRINHSASTAYVAEIDNVLVGWCSILHFAGSKNIKKIHRLVVIPDYQGIGIGGSLLNFVSSKYKNLNYRVRITSALLALFKKLKKDKSWILVLKPKIESQLGESTRRKSLKQKIARKTFTFEYKDNNT